MNEDELIEAIRGRLKKMPADVLASPLRELFNRPKLSGPFGTIVVADSLVNIDDLWTEFAINSLISQGLNKYQETGEERTVERSELEEVLSEASDDAWPYEAFAKDTYRNLATFAFDGRGPASNWAIDLHWMRPEADRAYICLPNDPEIEQPWLAIAALEPPSADILRTFLIDFLGTDGEEYGLRGNFPGGHFLRSFPTEVWQTDSELVPRATLRDALVAFLALKQRGSDDDWKSLVAEEIKVLFERRLPTARTDSDRASVVDEYLSWNDKAQERWKRQPPAETIEATAGARGDAPLTASPVVSGFDGSAVQVEPTTGRVVGEWLPVGTLGGKLDSLDFPTPAELCRCCGQELLQSGSRWSVWFCSECKGRVRTLNERAGTCVIPIGRHSMMNGVFIPGGRIPEFVEIEGFTLKVRGLSWEMERLAEWAAEIVRRNCVAGGLIGRALVPLSEYLEVLRAAGLARKDAFAAMLEWWRA